MQNEHVLLYNAQSCIHSILTIDLILRRQLGVVAPPRKLFPNWAKVSLRTTYSSCDWRIKFKQANEKQSSEQVLHFPERLLLLNQISKLKKCQMCESSLKRFKPNTEEGKLTELSSCKMSLITRHQCLQVESVDGKIKMCGHEELINGLCTKIAQEIKSGFESYKYEMQYGKHCCNLLTIRKRRDEEAQIKNDTHEILKMEIIQRLTEDGFKIISTVFDPNKESGGAEKHMMYKEFQQPANQSGTDEAVANKVTS